MNSNLQLSAHVSATQAPVDCSKPPPQLSSTKCTKRLTCPHVRLGHVTGNSHIFTHLTHEHFRDKNETAEEKVMSEGSQTI